MLSNGQSKLVQTDRDGLSCGSKSEGEIESEEDDELDSTITSTPDDSLVPEPSTSSDFYPELHSQSTEATTVSSLPGIREDLHTMVCMKIAEYLLIVYIFFPFRASPRTLKVVVWILNYLKMYLSLIVIC